MSRMFINSNGQVEIVRQSEVLNRDDLVAELERTKQNVATLESILSEYDSLTNQNSEVPSTPEPVTEPTPIDQPEMPPVEQPTAPVAEAPVLESPSTEVEVPQIEIQ